MTYIEKQNAWMEFYDIKPGDKVKVMRKAKSNEQGWDNSWIPEMDDMIGETFKFVYDGGYIGLGEEEEGPYFPYFVLEKVTEPQKASPCQLHDSEGYDEEYMDSIIRNAKEIPWQWQPSGDATIPNGASASFTFNLQDPDSQRLFRIYAQAEELHAFAWDIMYNLLRQFEYAWDEDMDGDPVEMLRETLGNFFDKYQIDVE